MGPPEYQKICHSILPPYGQHKMEQKRNEYLDISDEEEDAAISDGEFPDEGRFTRIQQSSGKRRKLNPADEEDSEGSQVEEEEDNEGTGNNQVNAAVAAENTTKQEEENNQDHEESHDSFHIPAAKPAAPSLKLGDNNAHQRKRRKTGVIYLSKIPPFMKPSALRHLLAPHGTLLRIFLTPEPSPSYLRRVKSGGNKKRSFVDGWVEFASKKKAKVCAETLNGNIIGGKKGGWYHDDIWNIKYLKGFKWDDLMEQVQDEERIREGRLRAEIQQEAKERRAFMENVERDKKEKTREAKRKKRLDGSGERATIHTTENEEERPMWTQNKVKLKEKRATIDTPDDVVRVLSKIF